MASDVLTSLDALTEEQVDAAIAETQQAMESASRRLRQLEALKAAFGPAPKRRRRKAVTNDGK